MGASQGAEMVQLRWMGVGDVENEGLAVQAGALRASVVPAEMLISCPGGSPLASPIRALPPEETEFPRRPTLRI